MDRAIVIVTVVLWLVLAVPNLSNLSRAKKRLADARWRLAKRQFAHTAKFVAGRAASMVLGPAAGALAGRLLHPHDAHASTADAAHHALGHASHVAQAAHHWLPVVGWVFSATRAVRGYAADPVVSDARDEIELWTRIISRLRKIVAAQTAGAVVIVWLVLR